VARDADLARARLDPAALVREKPMTHAQRPERRYPLTAIPWPQSVCRGCGHIGSSISPFCLCRCSDGYTTVFTLQDYRALVATLPRQERGTRSEAMIARWDKYREQASEVEIK
jgi:hypothetical protein